jgi:deoxyhypusine synthase
MSKGEGLNQTNVNIGGTVSKHIADKWSMNARRLRYNIQMMSSAEHEG